MKVFISWSGEKSRRIALALKEWFPVVMQNLRPYVSSEDIGKGTRWSRELQSELESSEFGILCVTRENMDAPWLMFEAGVLSKVGISRVSPFLYDIQPPEITGPMQLFQATVFDRRDIWNLVSELNRMSGPGALPEKRLAQVFDRWYPDLERRLNALRNLEPDTPEGIQAKMVSDVAAIRRRMEENQREEDRRYQDLTAVCQRLEGAVATLAQGMDCLHQRSAPPPEEGTGNRSARG